MRGILSFSLGIAMACCLSTAPANAATTVKVSVVTNNGDVLVTAMQDTFTKFIEEKSKGKYKVDTYFGGALGGCDSVFQGVQFGTINIAIDSTSNLSQFAPELAVVDMPFLMPTEKDLRKITEGPYSKKFMKYLDKTGVKTVALIFSTYRPLVSLNHWETLEDIQGQKFRSTASKTHMAAISSLGMTPTPMPPTEMVTGIQQGVVGGSDTEILGIINYRFCDVAKNVLIADHIPVIFVLYCSASWYDSLSDEDKALFDEAFQAYYAETQRVYAEKAAWTLRECKEKYGMNVTYLSPEEKKRWIEKSKTAYESLSPAQTAVCEEIREALKSRI